jgi:hypothetical protein
MSLPTQVLGVDGTLDVKVTTSGYIQATAFRSFYPRHYGFPVFNNVSGVCVCSCVGVLGKGEVQGRAGAEISSEL